MFDKDKKSKMVLLFCLLVEFFVSRLCFCLVVFIVIFLTFLRLVEDLIIDGADFVRKEITIGYLKCFW